VDDETILGLFKVDTMDDLLANLSFLRAEGCVDEPPPARAAEALGGGWGVMTDDLVAALYANACGQILWRLLLPGGVG
jgi:hypothetical protein